MTADEAVQYEMQERLIALATKVSRPGDSKKKIWAELARVTGLTYNQCERIWQLEWKIIPGSVVRKLDKLVADQKRLADAEQDTNRTRYWALNNQSTDPDFYSARTATSDRQADGLDRKDESR